MRMSVRYSGRQNNRPKQLSVSGFFEENGIAQERLRRTVEELGSHV